MVTPKLFFAAFFVVAVVIVMFFFHSYSMPPPPLVHFDTAHQTSTPFSQLRRMNGEDAVSAHILGTSPSPRSNYSVSIANNVSGAEKNVSNGSAITQRGIKTRDNFTAFTNLCGSSPTSSVGLDVANGTWQFMDRAALLETLGYRHTPNASSCAAAGSQYAPKGVFPKYYYSSTTDCFELVNFHLCGTDTSRKEHILIVGDSHVRTAFYEPLREMAGTDCKDTVWGEKAKAGYVYRITSFYVGGSNRDSMKISYTHALMPSNGHMLSPVRKDILGFDKRRRVTTVVYGGGAHCGIYHFTGFNPPAMIAMVQRDLVTLAQLLPKARLLVALNAHHHTDAAVARNRAKFDTVYYVDHAPWCMTPPRNELVRASQLVAIRNAQDEILKVSMKNQHIPRTVVRVQRWRGRKLRVTEELPEVRAPTNLLELFDAFDVSFRVSPTPPIQAFDGHHYDHTDIGYNMAQKLLNAVCLPRKKHRRTFVNQLPPQYDRLVSLNRSAMAFVDTEPLCMCATHVHECYNASKAQLSNNATMADLKDFWRFIKIKERKNSCT